jgi:hypothetical protein
VGRSRMMHGARGGGGGGDEEPETIGRSWNTGKACCQRSHMRGRGHSKVGGLRCTGGAARKRASKQGHACMPLRRVYLAFVWYQMSYKR